MTDFLSYRAFVLVAAVGLMQVTNCQKPGTSLEEKKWQVALVLGAHI